MPDLELQAEPRTVLGKKVAALRRRGLTPANIYGHSLPSQAVQVPTLELSHLLRRAGHTHLIRLQVAGEGSPRMVLVRDISRKATNDQLLHIDFYQVRMNEKTTVEVPIVITGSAPAVEEGLGVLFQQVSLLPVDCLPQDIPDHIEVDISSLSGVHSLIHLRDIALPGSVTTTVDPDEVIVSISVDKSSFEEEAAATQEAEAEAPTEPAEEQ